MLINSVSEICAITYGMKFSSQSIGTEPNATLGGFLNFLLVSY